MDKVYNSKESEETIYQMWERAGYFTAKITPKKKPFCIIMPPPNANGSLHIGHAVFVTLQDIMIRYHRMKGDCVLWLPGADHAGFETQVVYDKKLEKEGRRRSEIPKEQLLKEMLDFTLKNKEVMENQLRKLGASCDWKRNKFTLDPDIVKIVYRTFEKLQQDGLLYRGERIVNWCCKHQTSLSDLEIKYEERTDRLYFIKYKLSVNPKSEIRNPKQILNSKSQILKPKYIVVATTRPETMLGDTAVAVNPKDKRYEQLIGSTLILPIIEREIPVIADEAVEMAFGTGAVKITPAHDLADFDIWQKHKREIASPIAVIDKYGKMNEGAGEYTGLKAIEAREKIVSELEQKGLLEKVEQNYKHNVAVCYKCGTVIEPMLLQNQWFIKMTEKPKKGGLSLRDGAVQAVKKGDVKFVPRRFEKIFLQWLKNLRDWNISRQIPWGIKIPAWHCQIKNPADKKMGFHENVIPQVFDGKISTWRLRDHKLKVGDRVAFENSQTEELFGYGEITCVSATTIGKIDLQDKTHYKTYKNYQELIRAYKRYYPAKEIDQNTPVFAYSYKFRKINSSDCGCGRVMVSPDRPERCTNCGSTTLTQDSDVFDTWFSSGQWTFAPLLANSKRDFEYFYPTAVMETGWDILFFWVARMVMLGIYVTGKAPFRTVFLHGLVRDKDRQKMSKSKGNVIDPLGVIDLYGADALRMALVFATSPGQDVVLSEDKIIAQRRFCNKIWNAARFVLTQSKENGKSEIRNPKSETNSKFKIQNSKLLTSADKKILKDLSVAVKAVTKDIENFQFHEAAQKIYHFFWHNFCDQYIEISKSQIQNAKSEKVKTNTRNILFYVLFQSLKLLHPFMPFLTEQIYQMLPFEQKKALIIAPWPSN